MQLLYGPNTGQSNNGCYESKAFDALYEKARRCRPIRPSATGCSSTCRGRWKSTAHGACTSSRDAQPDHPAVGEGLQEASDPAAPSSSTWTSTRGRELMRTIARPLVGHGCVRCARLARVARRARRGAGRRRGADLNKVIRHVFPAAETGFDPAGVQDLYSATIEQMMFETLLTYDYLARPAKLVPLDRRSAAAGHRHGKTYTVQDAARASISSTIRRSRASSASWPPPTTRTR